MKDGNLKNYGNKSMEMVRKLKDNLLFFFFFRTIKRQSKDSKQINKDYYREIKRKFEFGLCFHILFEINVSICSYRGFYISFNLVDHLEPPNVFKGNINGSNPPFPNY